MTRVDLDKLSNREAVAEGDKLMRKGAFAAALELYRALLPRGPNVPQLLARIGLASNPNERTAFALGAQQSLERIPGSNAFVAEGLATWLKTLPFLDDARFMDLVEAHSELLPLPNWHWNLQTALWAAQQGLRKSGDFVELGVFKGHTTLFLADYLEFGREDRTWWLYDTFAGIPADQLDDERWEKVDRRVYGGTYSYEEVAARFARFPNIRVIQGRVPEILSEAAPEAISFLHVDLNNTAAEIAALDLLFDRITLGGVILFDDFLWSTSVAQYEAERAWFARRGLFVLPLPTGQGLFVKT